MNKALTIGFVALMVVVLTLATYFVMKRQSHVENEGVPTMEETGSTDTSMQTKSLRDLLALGNNQMCTFTDSETNSGGTIYISSNRVRNDFTSQINGATVGSHMIIEADTMYMWQDGMEGGFKMSLVDYESTSTSDSDNSTPQNKTVDINKQVDYQCESWNTDETVFDIPLDREFSDMSAVNQMMQKPQELDTTGTSDQCDVCENLPAGAKEQCLSSLSCN